MSVDYGRPYGHAPASAVNRRAAPAATTAKSLAELDAELAGVLLAKRDRAAADEAAAIFKANPEAYAIHVARERGRSYQQPIEKAAPEPLSRAERLAADSGIAEREWAAELAKRQRALAGGRAS